MTIEKAGQAWLHERFSLKVPPAFVVSSTGPGVRRTSEAPHGTREHYPPTYAPGDSISGQIRFALKNEPLDTGLMYAAFTAMGPAPIVEWVNAEPNSAYARRAWFLYEFLTQQMIELPDAGTVTYTDALSSSLNVVSGGRSSKRHKVTDNMLGVPGFCPSVRRTRAIDATLGSQLDMKAASYVANIPREVLERAVRYLFTKETQSSFEIEREKPSPKKAERFVAALERGKDIDPTDPSALVKLQNIIVDPRYAATGYRDFQNFVGETLGDYRERVHFVCPKPDDIENLMSGWSEMTRRLRDGTDPITAAAMSGFAFVFLHPFEDGNGRLHRFLFHHVLSKTGFTPGGIIFPVSASILRDSVNYDSALESFSKPLLEIIDWSLTSTKTVEVTGKTDHLYRYFDATRHVEFLGNRIADTIEVDLKSEIGFIMGYDKALKAVRDVVDMPNRRASLLALLLVQGNGILSKRKREQFKEISDDEILSMQEALSSVDVEDSYRM